MHIIDTVYKGIESDTCARIDLDLNTQNVVVYFSIDSCFARLLCA